MSRVMAILVGVAFVTTACGAVHKRVEPQASELGTIKRIAVVVTGDDPFRVVAERAEGSGGKAALGGAGGGMIGFLIVGGIAANRAEARDKEMAKVLVEHLDGFTPHATFGEAFTRALRDSGRPFEVILLDKAPGGSAPYDAIAEFRIEEWGIRKAVATDADRLAGFIRLKARLAKSVTDELLWAEHDTVLGQGRLDMASYRADGGALRNELRHVAADAGYRMAIKILYPKEAAK